MSSEIFQPPSLQSTGEAVIRALHQQMMDAWNKGSGEVYAAPFAEDDDLIGFDGTHFKGRQEIASFHQRLFDTHLKGTRLIGKVTSIRFLSPEVALMYAVGETVMRGKSTPSPERDSIQTLVATRRGGDRRSISVSSGHACSTRSQSLAETPAGATHRLGLR
jgi:uncharacterized protein (TIGR02246 family)